jgi:hypothetical protein
MEADMLLSLHGPAPQKRQCSALSGLGEAKVYVCLQPVQSFGHNRGVQKCTAIVQQLSISIAVQTMHSTEMCGCAYGTANAFGTHCK